MDRVIKELSDNHIEAVKLNFNVDRSLQRYCQYDCKIQLSEDASSIEIFNLKPKDTPVFYSKKKKGISQKNIK